MLLSSKHLFQLSTPVGDRYLAGRFYLSAWAEPGKFLSVECGPSGFSTSDTFEAADVGIWGLLSSGSHFTAFVSCLRRVSNPLVQAHHLLFQL